MRAGNAGQRRRRDRLACNVLPLRTTDRSSTAISRGRLYANKRRQRREMARVRDATVFYLKRIAVRDRERAGDVGCRKRCEHGVQLDRVPLHDSWICGRWRFSDAPFLVLLSALLLDPLSPRRIGSARFLDALLFVFSAGLNARDRRKVVRRQGKSCHAFLGAKFTLLGGERPAALDARARNGAVAQRASCCSCTSVAASRSEKVRQWRG